MALRTIARKDRKNIRNAQRTPHKSALRTSKSPLFRSRLPAPAIPGRNRGCARPGENAGPMPARPPCGRRRFRSVRASATGGRGLPVQDPVPQAAAAVRHPEDTGNALRFGAGDPVSVGSMAERRCRLGPGVRGHPAPAADRHEAFRAGCRPPHGGGAERPALPGPHRRYAAAAAVRNRSGNIRNPAGTRQKSDRSPAGSSQKARQKPGKHPAKTRRDTNRIPARMRQRSGNLRPDRNRDERRKSAAGNRTSSRVPPPEPGRDEAPRDTTRTAARPNDPANRRQGPLEALPGKPARHTKRSRIRIAKSPRQTDNRIKKYLCTL